MGRQPVFHVVLALGSSDPPTDSNDTIRPAASESKLKISNPILTLTPKVLRIGERVKRFSQICILSSTSDSWNLPDALLPFCRAFFWLSHPCGHPNLCGHGVRTNPRK